MKKNPVKIPDSFHIVKTYLQAKFYLDKGEVLSMPLSLSKSIHMKKAPDTEDLYQLAIVPLVGKSSCYEGDSGAIKNILADYDFYIFKGATLTEKAPTLWDKAYDSFTRLFSAKKG